MIKKIATAQLRKGMFIHDLNCGWMESPFVRNQFKLGSKDDISKIAGLGVKELYIDTSKGLDAPEAPSRRQVQESLDSEIHEVLSESTPEEKTVSVQAERKAAEQVEKEAKRVVTDIMEDARLGKQIELEKVNPVVEGMVESIFRNKDALLSLGRIRQMDQYTFQHSVGVCVLMTSFAKVIGLERDVITKIATGALLHDIGKTQTPDHILNKPGKLTDEEFAIMRDHVVQSRELLAETKNIDPVSLAVAAEHHERYDGSGYPNKLAGDDISIYGQMAAIVDVYDAITADRCYHEGMEPTAALSKILEWSKFHFNPLLAQQFIQCVGIYPVGTLVRLKSDRLAVVVEPGRDTLLKPTVRLAWDIGRSRALAPTDVDLGDSGSGADEGIIAHESPKKWNIHPEELMDIAPKSVG